MRSTLDEQMSLSYPILSYPILSYPILSYPPPTRPRGPGERERNLVLWSGVPCRRAYRTSFSQTPLRPLISDSEPETIPYGPRRQFSKARYDKAGVGVKS